MKVKELIKELQKFDENSEVLVYGIGRLHIELFIASKISKRECGEDKEGNIYEEISKYTKYKRKFKGVVIK